MSGDRSGDELLTATGMTKRFSGVTALDRVDLALAAGEARGLIGENGAGKSTLIALLTGALAADAGELRFRGRPIAFQRPVDALRAGIAAVYQQNWLIPNLTVAQNIELGRETARTPLRVLSRRVQDQTIDALELVGAVSLADRHVASLSLAQRQLVAVARAYSRGSRLIIFDEPTASLSPVETELLATVIARLRQAGIALLYVTHRLDELPLVTDTVTVLRAGRVVGECPSSTPEGRLVDLMAGNEAVARESRIADRLFRRRQIGARRNDDRRPCPVIDRLLLLVELHADEAEHRIEHIGVFRRLRPRRRRAGKHREGQKRGHGHRRAKAASSNDTGDHALHP